MPQSNPEQQRPTPEALQGPQEGSLEWGKVEYKALIDSAGFVKSNGDTFTSQDERDFKRALDKLIDPNYLKGPLSIREYAKEDADNILAAVRFKQSSMQYQIRKGFIQEGTPFHKMIQDEMQNGSSTNAVRLLQHNKKRCKLVDQIKQQGDVIKNPKTLEELKNSANPGGAMEEIKRLSENADRIKAKALLNSLDGK